MYLQKQEKEIIDTLELTPFTLVDYNKEFLLEKMKVEDIKEMLFLLFYDNDFNTYTLHLSVDKERDLIFICKESKETLPKGTIIEDWAITKINDWLENPIVQY